MIHKMKRQSEQIFVAHEGRGWWVLHK